MGINLIEVIGEHLDCSLQFKVAFDCKTGIYYPEDVIDIRLFPNNLKGGYQGNTLLVEISNNKDFFRSGKDIRVDNFIFTKCQLMIPFDNKEFCLKGKYGYLRLKADLLTPLK